MGLDNKDLQLLAEEFKIMLDQANVEVANLRMLHKKERASREHLSEINEILELELVELRKTLDLYDQKNLVENN